VGDILNSNRRQDRLEIALAGLVLCGAFRGDEGPKFSEVPILLRLKIGELLCFERDGRNLKLVNVAISLFFAPLEFEGGSAGWEWPGRLGDCPEVRAAIVCELRVVI
jgi:hypothetical protein